MSIQDKITRLQTAKTDIAEAIVAKGGAVGENDGFEEFSSDTGTIETGITPGGELSITENGTYDVTQYASADVVVETYKNDLLKTIGRNITHISIPRGVDGSGIGDYAFAQCYNLESVTIPDSMWSIGTNAFQNCESLTSIILPNHMSTIGDNAFQDCSALENITMPTSVTSIGQLAFLGCVSLTDIYYGGTQAQWESIVGLSSASIPESCTIHYEYTPTQ